MRRHDRNGRVVDATPACPGRSVGKSTGPDPANTLPKPFDFHDDRPATMSAPRKGPAVQGTGSGHAKGPISAHCRAIAALPPLAARLPFPPVSRRTPVPSPGKSHEDPQELEIGRPIRYRLRTACPRPTPEKVSSRHNRLCGRACRRKAPTGWTGSGQARLPTAGARKMTTPQPGGRVRTGHSRRSAY